MTKTAYTLRLLHPDKMGHARHGGGKCLAKPGPCHTAILSRVDLDRTSVISRDHGTTRVISRNPHADSVLPLVGREPCADSPMINSLADITPLSSPFDGKATASG